MIATDSKFAEKISSFVITQKVSSPQGTIRLSRQSVKTLTIALGLLIDKQYSKFFVYNIKYAQFSSLQNCIQKYISYFAKTKQKKFQQQFEEKQ